MVNVTNLSVIIDKKTILNSITCALTPGRITTFIGKSGAGKTTLLKTIAHLIPITTGTITVCNKPISNLSFQELAKTIGYVFQNYNLFPHMTALENCMDPLIVQGISYKEAKQNALSTLHQLEISNLADRYPCQLSGGQQQRVAIARALCLNPQVLLLDEPTASLDPLATQTLAVILKNLAKTGLTIGISSQDMYCVDIIFDRVIFLESGALKEVCEDKKMIMRYPHINHFLRGETSF